MLVPCLKLEQFSLVCHECFSFFTINSEENNNVNNMVVNQTIFVA